MIRARTFGFAAPLSLALACGSPAPEPTSGPTPTEHVAMEEPAAARVGGEVVATVHGEPITVGEVDEVARTTGLTPLEALRRLEDERVLSRLASRSELAQDASADRAARRAAVRALLAREIEAGRAPETVTEAELEARRAEIAAMLSSPETRRASHALVVLPEDAPVARADAARRLARRIRDEIRVSPDPAAALDAYAGAQGGLEVTVEHLDPVSRESVVAPFADALFGAAGPGLIEEPVRTNFGVHVIVLDEIVPPWEVPREEWEAVLRRQIAAERRAQATEALAERLAAQTPVALDPAAARLAETMPLGPGSGPGAGASGGR